jgi:peptide deformylase
MLELKEGAIKHVGASNKTATAKLYDVTEAEVREFGDERVKLSCRDESGNEVEIALDPTEAKTVAHEIEQLEADSRVFE